MHEHRLALSHYRGDIAVTLDRPSADSDVSVDTTSTDLTEAWRELLSRLPTDLYAALRAAMPKDDR